MFGAGAHSYTRNLAPSRAQYAQTAAGKTSASVGAAACFPAGWPASGVRCQPCNCALVGAGEHPTGTQCSRSMLHDAGHANHIVHIVLGCASISLYSC